MDTPLIIERDVEIHGTTNDAGDVILRRSTTLGDSQHIMEANGGLTVEIRWLTFDGNRTGASSCGTTPTNHVVDLHLQFVDLATVQHVNFIRSPHETMYLGGNPPPSTASTISYSNFGQGFVNATRGYNLTGPQTANRITGIWLYGDYTGVWENNFAHQGTAAVNSFSGSYHYIVGNRILRNRYEQPDGVWGGQIYIDGPVGTSVANNWINGDYWETGNAQQANPANDHYTICAPGDSGQGSVFPHGIETFGDYHQFYNNWILQNLGYGMLLRPPRDPNTQMLVGTLNHNIISGYDPFCTGGCSFVPLYIEKNAGCWSFGTPCFNTPEGWPAGMAVAGITVYGDSAAQDLVLDHVRSTNNGRFGVSIYEMLATSPTAGKGFTDSQNGGVNYACIPVTGGQENAVAPLNFDSGSNAVYKSRTNLCP